ncbi:hypothetical protein Nmel_017811 [Mimus melanotis]
MLFSDTSQQQSHSFCNQKKKSPSQTSLQLPSEEFQRIWEKQDQVPAHSWGSHIAKLFKIPLRTEQPRLFEGVPKQLWIIGLTRLYLGSPRASYLPPSRTRGNFGSQQARHGAAPNEHVHS